MTSDAPSSELPPETATAPERAGLFKRLAVRLRSRSTAKLREDLTDALSETASLAEARGSLILSAPCSTTFCGCAKCGLRTC